MGVFFGVLSYGSYRKYLLPANPLYTFLFRFREPKVIGQVSAVNDVLSLHALLHGSILLRYSSPGLFNVAITALLCISLRVKVYHKLAPPCSIGFAKSNTVSYIRPSPKGKMDGHFIRSNEWN